jgi:hypothetical protein
MMVRDFIHAHWQLMVELAGLFLILGVVIVLGGTLIARFDKISIADGIYFACITALTVVLAMLGLIMFGIVVAVAVHALDVALELT